MKTYQIAKTSHKDLFRVIDREGEWQWYWHKGEKKFLRSVNYILEEGYSKGVRFYEYLKNNSKEETDRILREAGERGDRIHQAIFLLLRDGTIDRNTQVLAEDNKTPVNLSNDEWDCLLAFGEFWNRHDCKLIVKEYAVFNLTQEYAGTTDGVLIMKKNCGIDTCKCDNFIGQVGLFDWKSGGAIYESYGPQVAAYASCDNLPKKIEYTAILRIGSRHKKTGGYELKIYDIEETIAHAKEFIAAIVIQDAHYEPFDESMIREIPDSINIIARKKNGKRLRNSQEI